jgi:hypothetical protein
MRLTARSCWARSPRRVRGSVPPPVRERLVPHKRPYERPHRPRRQHQSRSIPSIHASDTIPNLSFIHSKTIYPIPAQTPAFSQSKIKSQTNANLQTDRCLPCQRRQIPPSHQPGGSPPRCPQQSHPRPLFSRTLVLEGESCERFNNLLFGLDVKVQPQTAIASTKTAPPSFVQKVA